MKIIRLTDDKFIFDAGPNVTREKFEQIGEYWKAWWEPGADPSLFIISGEKLEYEDQRNNPSQLDDIERKLDLLLDMLS